MEAVFGLAAQTAGALRLDAEKFLPLLLELIRRGMVPVGVAFLAAARGRVVMAVRGGRVSEVAATAFAVELALISRGHGHRLQKNSQHYPEKSSFFTAT